MATENVYSNLAIPPGEFLQEEVEARGLPVAALLEALHLQPRQLERLLAGDERITAEMALDLENLLQLSADFWLGLQAEYDLTLARNRRLAQSA
ncbi:MAG: addiction module antidote protein, HigA family [Anaerolinea sp.]|nr:addiction module antidote protein, HigA family [Anaerolinea sp.]